MNNWKTSILGIGYAMLILLLQQLITGSIDWITIAEAGAAIVFGLKAADNVKAQGAYTLLIVEWRTTIIGLLTAAGALLFTYYKAGEPLTSLVIVKAVGVSLLGIISNDSKTKIE